MESQKTIGIVGGGQLGRMLTLAALPLGFRVVVINPSPNSPAAQVGAEELVADLYDADAIAKLAEMSDYITVEIEHLDTTSLQKIAAAGKHVNPLPETIILIQDKYKQKQFLYEAGVPVADFAEITDLKSAKNVFKQFGGKMLIKTKHGAYDGRGNMLIEKVEDIEKAYELFKERELYAEAYVPFEKELAVMIARSINGDIAIYPVVETVHERNICVEVIAPAEIDQKTNDKAREVAMQVAELLQGAGTFGIEMFLTKTGKVLVNEIAPRVHNSGHYTMEANRTSQFEQHVRAISGLPLGDTNMIVPAAVMVNVLGERDGDTIVAGLDEALKNPGVSVHLYGKSPTKVDRKMGHITATAENVEKARVNAKNAIVNLKV